jgi:hypothetical protein
MVHEEAKEALKGRNLLQSLLRPYRAIQQRIDRLPRPAAWAGMSDAFSVGYFIAA